MDNSVKLKIIKANQEAAAQIELIKQDNCLKYTQLLECLTKYIKCKFGLNEEDFKQDDLYELAKISLARTLKISLNRLENKDIGDCTGTTSSTMKKVLLIMAIEKELNINFSESESADIDTIPNLARMVFEKLRDKNVLTIL